MIYSHPTQTKRFHLPVDAPERLRWLREADAANLEASSGLGTGGLAWVLRPWETYGSTEGQIISDRRATLFLKKPNGNPLLSRAAIDDGRRSGLLPGVPLITPGKDSGPYPFLNVSLADARVTAIVAHNVSISDFDSFVSSFRSRYVPPYMELNTSGPPVTNALYSATAANDPLHGALPLLPPITPNVHQFASQVTHPAPHHQSPLPTANYSFFQGMAVPPSQFPPSFPIPVSQQPQCHPVHASPVLRGQGRYDKTAAAVDAGLSGRPLNAQKAASWNHDLARNESVARASTVGQGRVLSLVDDIREAAVQDGLLWHADLGRTVTLFCTTYALQSVQGLKTFIQASGPEHFREAARYICDEQSPMSPLTSQTFAVLANFGRSPAVEDLAATGAGQGYTAGPSGELEGFCAGPDRGMESPGVLGGSHLGGSPNANTFGMKNTVSGPLKTIAKTQAIGKQRQKYRERKEHDVGEMISVLLCCGHLNSKLTRTDLSLLQTRGFPVHALGKKPHRLHHLGDKEGLLRVPKCVFFDLRKAGLAIIDIFKDVDYDGGMCRLMIDVFLSDDVDCVILIGKDVGSVGKSMCAKASAFLTEYVSALSKVIT